MSDRAAELLRAEFESIPAAVPAEVLDAARAEGPRLSARGRGRVRRRIAIAMAVVIALAAASFTPPGRAATDWVSDLLAGPNTFEPGQYGYQLHTSTLIGSGELPTGDPYQVRGYVNSNGPGAPVGCVAIVWQHSAHSLPECSNVPGWNGNRVSIAVAGRLPEDEQDPGAHGVVVLGAAPNESTEVRIRVPESAGVSASDEPAQLFPIDGAISDTAGAVAQVPRVKIFVGYLPPGAGDYRTAPPAHAVALGDERELAATELSWTRFTFQGGRIPSITACVKRDPLCQQLARPRQGGGTP
jgi:hypothetical protein